DSAVASTPRAKQPRIAGTDVGYPDVTRVTSPTSVLDQYRWPKRFLQASVQAWGKDYVVDGLSMMSWKLSTTFSGMGCFESAAVAVRENVRVFLRQNNRRESACIELRSALDFDTKDIVFFENTPGYEAVDFFWDKANGCPGLSMADKETIRGYRRTFGQCKKVFDLSQRNPAYFRTELVDDSMLALKTNTKLYCDDEKHKRVMSAEEICACLVLPCNKNFARISKGPPFAVDSVNYNAIAHLVGNGMNVAEDVHEGARPWVDRMKKSLETFNVDADEHPCQLVEKYMATTDESFGLLLNNMNAWLVGNGVEALNLENFKFPKEDGPDSLPVLAFNMVKPTEGFPPLVQFQRWCESIWFSFEKSREPLEVHPLDVLPGERLQQGGVGLTKGFTRSSVILYGIIRTVMIEDPESFSDTEKEFFTTWLTNVLVLPVIYTDHPGFNLDTALNTAFEEYNNFGLARQSTQFRLSEREMYGKQLLFMQRVLFTFNIRKKQVRSLSTARCTAEQWELMLETSCLAHQLLEDMKAAKDDAGAALFREADIAKARQRALEGHRDCIVSSALRFIDDARDYSSEIQNLTVAKMDFVASDLSFWQDHVTKPAAAAGSFGEGTCTGQNDAIKALDIESVQKAFQADLLKVSEDCSRFSEYLSKLTAGKRQHAIAKVLKLKAENRRGAQLVVDWMHRYAKFATNDFVEEHMNIVEAAGFIVAPTMVSSRVVAGKRGELRRLPLLFPAWVAVNDSATSNIFGSSKMLVNECTKNEIPWLPVREYRVPRAKNMAPCTTEAADRMISYSCGPNVIETQYAQRLLAQKLVEDWRSGTHPLGNTVPKYSPELQDDTDAISTPELLVCEMSTDAATGDKKLILNGTLRGKWLDDPSRKDEWLAELAKFDA
ncbi:unnamed protein product, partial [Symbiodinium necroappetens]